MNTSLREGIVCIYIDNNCAPVAKEVSRGRSRPDEAPNFIAFIESTPHHLPS